MSSCRVEGSSAPRTTSLGKEDHLMHAIVEHSAREAEEVATRNLCEIKIEQIFVEQGITTSHASASKEADLRVMKAEEAKQV
ncbi:Nitrate reductase (NADH) [Hordeum vulgare]|nr:Nitrate reductase (NADH) [Hordeum vulgare]